MYNVPNQKLIICKVNEVETKTPTGQPLKHRHHDLNRWDPILYKIYTTQCFIGDEKVPTKFVKRCMPHDNVLWVTPGQMIKPNSYKALTDDSARVKGLWFVLRDYEMASTYKGKKGVYHIYKGTMVDERDIDKVIAMYKSIREEYFDNKAVAMSHKEVIDDTLEYALELIQNRLAKAKEAAKKMRGALDDFEFSGDKDD